MKKIITPAVHEVSELICDVTGQPAVAGLAMWFGDGSQRDLHLLKVHLSDEVAEEVLQLLQSKYPQFQPKEDESLSCPVCERRCY